MARTPNSTTAHETTPSSDQDQVSERESPQPATDTTDPARVAGGKQTPASPTGRPDPGRRRLGPPWLLPAALGALLLALVLGPQVPQTTGNELTYSQVLTAASAGEVTKAEIDDNTQTVTITKEDGSTAWAHFPAGASKDLATRLNSADIEVDVTAVSRPSIAGSLLLTLLPVMLIIGFLFFLLRRGGGLGLGALRSGRKTGPVEVPDTRFSDLAGVDEAVHELAEVVTFLHDPSRFARAGATMPRGFLLVGPPGTGKTMLARAVAGEAGVPFFALTGSDFVEMFVGVGAARVRELFDKARASENGAIVFIDEIDAVGKARAKGIATGANDERESTLNQLLVEMDGFAQTPKLIMIAATNRPDVLDPALTRPGRFDRKIYVPAPDRAGRLALLELYQKGRPFSDIEWASVARRTPGMTGADIAQMLNEAAMEAAREGSDVITQAHVEASLATTVLGRERKSAVVTERDREIVAWHEAGHTMAALLLKDADDPVSVTIVPRGSAGGVTWLGGSEHDFMTRSQARARLVVAMAGRAAEEILLDGDHTQGAHGDLESATGLAGAMITRYGMGKRLVAVDPDRISITGHDLDGEIAEMLTEALERARHLLTEKRRALEAVAHALLENETLNLEQVQKIVSEAYAETDPREHYREDGDPDSVSV